MRYYRGLDRRKLRHPIGYLLHRRGVTVNEMRRRLRIGKQTIYDQLARPADHLTVAQLEIIAAWLDMPLHDVVDLARGVTIPGKLWSDLHEADE